MKRIGAIVLLALAVLLAAPASAQRRLSLDSALSMALRNSRDIQAARMTAEAALEFRKSMWGKFFPRIGLTAGYLRTNKDIMPLGENLKIPVVPSEFINPATGAVEQDYIANYLRSEAMKGNLAPAKLAQETFVLDKRNKPVLGEDGNPLFRKYAYLPGDQFKLDHHNFFNVGVNVVQPIWVGGRIITANRMAQSGAELARATAEVQEEEVLFDTEKAYWQVISLQEKGKVVAEYQAMVNRISGDVDNLVAEGIILRNAKLQVQVKKNEIELNRIRVENGVRLAKMNLCQMVGLPLDTDIALEDSLTLDSYLLPNANYMDLSLIHI